MRARSLPESAHPIAVTRCHHKHRLRRWSCAKVISASCTCQGTTHGLAERNHLTAAMSVLDWAGNDRNPMPWRGAAANSIDTHGLKAKSALRWRRPPRK